MSIFKPFGADDFLRQTDPSPKDEATPVSEPQPEPAAGRFRRCPVCRLIHEIAPLPDLLEEAGGNAVALAASAGCRRSGCRVHGRAMPAMAIQSYTALRPGTEVVALLDPTTPWAVIDTNAQGAIAVVREDGDGGAWSPGALDLDELNALLAGHLLYSDSPAVATQALTRACGQPYALPVLDVEVLLTQLAKAWAVAGRQPEWTLAVDRAHADAPPYSREPKGDARHLAAVLTALMPPPAG